MLKTIILILSVVLTTVNLALLWQIFRKMKQNPNEKLATIEPYISARLTAFGMNMMILFLIFLGKALLQIFL